MLNKILRRLQNPKIALAVASGFVMILLNVGVIDMETSDKIMFIVNTVLGMGIALGIFSNPESHVEDSE